MQADLAILENFSWDLYLHKGFLNFRSHIRGHIAETHFYNPYLGKSEYTWIFRPSTAMAETDDPAKTWSAHEWTSTVTLARINPTLISL